jgi:hypothetical protein
MSKIIISKPNGEEEVRDMTSEEQAQWNTDTAQLASEKQAEEAKKQAETTDKANGNQKLLDLGLTQAEATALTGYTPPSED